MSKALIFVMVPMGLAIAGLGVMNLQMQGELDELRQQMADVETTATETADLARDVDDRIAEAVTDRGSRRTESIVRDIETRLAAVESVQPVASAILTSGPDEGDYQPVVDSATAVAVDADVERAVRAVLEAQDAERRAERRQREEEMRLARMLRGIEVTDAQREEVARVAADYYTKRRELIGDRADRGRRGRRGDGDVGAGATGGDEADREAARQQMSELRTQFQDDLAVILGTENAAKAVEQSGGPGGGRRGGDGGRRRGDF